ncbi:MAG: nucleotidyltransferase family protein [Solobacterium sp.]|nr:nucleotidyltransferase family protein [Solobacterium sp.]
MEMIEEQFLYAFKCAVYGISTDWDDEREISFWHQLFSMAEKHAVLPMIYEAVYNTASFRRMNDDYQKRIQSQATAITLTQAQRTANFLDLYQYLNRKGLYPVVVKGITSRSLYPQPEQRPSTDEDLLIPEEQYPAYHQALQEYGLKTVGNDTDLSEVSYKSQHLYIELHKKLFPPESTAYGDLNRYFNNAEEHKLMMEIYGVPVYTMDHTHHMLYLILHLYKHFLNCGIGIRQISDILLYSVRNQDRIDWDWVAEKCREVNAFYFTGTLYKIGEKYLCDTFPADLSAIWGTAQCDETAMLKDVLEGGMYGTSSSDRVHAGNMTLRTVEAERTGKKHPLRTILFPSYDYMKHRYTYVQKMPFLLPVSWIQRLWTYGTNSLLHKKKGDDGLEAMRIGSRRVELLRQYRILKDTGKK